MVSSKIGIVMPSYCPTENARVQTEKKGGARFGVALSEWRERSRWGSAPPESPRERATSALR
jgi:hypothetical protein